VLIEVDGSGDVGGLFGWEALMQRERSSTPLICLISIFLSLAFITIAGAVAGVVVPLLFAAGVGLPVLIYLAPFYPLIVPTLYTACKP
jgi:hypothetical protein